MTNHDSKPTPPRWATRLLRWYCAPHRLDEIQGDLQEEFDYQVERFGYERARRDYIRNVLGFIRPFAIRRRSSSPASASFININMYKHYLIVAFRNLIRHKAFSIINISGLALGMTCCLLIFLWVKDEESVDNFHENGARLYTVYQTIRGNGWVDASYSSPISYADSDPAVPLEDIRHVVPGVAHVASYATGYELPWGHPETFQVGEKIHKLEGSRAGEDFFTMFSYPLLAGDAATSLKDKSSLAISRKMAALFFESPEDAIGKSIRFENTIDFTVTAVFEDLSPKSSLKFDYLINWESHITRLVWAGHHAQTFIQLQESADVNEVTTSINRFLKSRLDPNEPFKREIGLQRFGNQYLVSGFNNGKPDGGRIDYVRIFTGVAIFILIIACINFMNLATARSLKRAREVGVRKAVGSSRANLVGQFLGESMLLTLLALITSLALVTLLLVPFNRFTGKQIALPLTEPTSWLALASLLLVTGFLAGSYPALFLSSLKPVRILKGVLHFTKSAVWFRKGLVIFQFSLSILLLIATLVISQQTGYVQRKNLGYDRKNLLYIRVEGELAKQQKYLAFKDLAGTIPGVVMMDRSSEAPHAMAFATDEPIQWEGKDQEKDRSTVFKPASVGFDFIKLMKLSIVEGRDFSRDNPADSSDAFMVNEEAVRQMGMKDPLGKWVSAWAKKGHIIGVLKDYHTHSLYEPIKPIIIDVKEYEGFGVVIVRLEPGKTKEALAGLEKVYKEINPSYPFAYQFVDREYDKLYRNEQVIAKLSNAFAVLAILISCLGLLGLVMFAAEQRTKEIGIRKVLGATVTNIISLLSKDFLLIVFVSFFIAAPIAGYFMNQWLQQFAFRIDLSWWIFATPGIAVLLVALLTISVQAVQAAVANPVKALKVE